MFILKRTTILKALKYMTLFTLMISSGWFMNDVWVKFQKKDTTFKQYEEQMNELPTTVLCLEPFAKESVLKEFNLTIYDLDNMVNLDKFPKPWKNFLDEVYFKLNRDFTIALRDYNELELGDNPIQLENSRNMIITVSELFTLWYGFCYLIKLSYTFNNQLIFTLTFNNQTLERNDIPTPQLYITSEENALGVLGMNWIYGTELRWSPKDKETGYKVTPIKRKTLSLKSHCNMNSNSNCIFELIKQSNITCNKSCLPVKFPNMDTILMPECDENNTIEEFDCMKWELHKSLFYNASFFCERHCNTMEYKGKQSFAFKYHGSSRFSIEWRYILDSAKVTVQEEYLVYDSTGIVGAIGGTLGLFVGFSFREVANSFFDSFELLMPFLNNLKNAK